MPHKLNQVVCLLPQTSGIKSFGMCRHRLQGEPQSSSHYILSPSVSLSVSAGEAAGAVHSGRRWHWSEEAERMLGRSRLTCKHAWLPSEEEGWNKWLWQ